jgi:hypothetical protein
MYVCCQIMSDTSKYVASNPVGGEGPAENVAFKCTHSSYNVK